MQINRISANLALDIELLKENVTRIEIDKFKEHLQTLFDKADTAQQKGEHEEHFKNAVSNFLSETWYKNHYEININKRKDLVIHHGKSASSAIGVIIEAKKPDNIAEMISLQNLNVKAFWELILYYFEEREQNKNIEVKHLIATNVFEWFVFDENDFDKLIYRNTKFKKLYQTKIENAKDNPFFYSETQKILAELEESIPCVYLNLNDFRTVEQDEDLIVLYKILSPQHLLKIPFANDSNTLNREFYDELLHIFGLEEVSEGGKIIITRKAEKYRENGTWLENTIVFIERKNPELSPDELFSIGLELCITWLNRILFLKLLEGQLLSYHNGNPDFNFINLQKIPNFTELEVLFFDVLAKKVEERNELVQTNFRHIPYLNSSLFEVSNYEKEYLFISNLNQNREIPLYSTSVLRHNDRHKNTKSLKTLEYLFEFLSAFNFASDSSVKIQEDNKNLINAAVLGLIFEKLNGYKDGSFFTPSSITMYMCRETIRKAVVQKFNELENLNFTRFENLKRYCSKDFEKADILRFNQHINTLRICDPAVGSGHFLVSALNEIIAIKSELGILVDKDGEPIRYFIKIEKDELVILYRNIPFEYVLDYKNKPVPELQIVQETLFNEKRTLIENCLFGVDINPKSVLICRLRLWIELLKNAYYTQESDFKELETLPNIDINIKVGNSLISRYKLQDDVFEQIPNFISKLNEYRFWVNEYKHISDKKLKIQLTKNIASFKDIFKHRDPRVVELEKKIAKKANEYQTKFEENSLLDDSKSKDFEKFRIKLEKEIAKLSGELDSLRSSSEQLYANAFEWRYEFPEILNENGEFMGFDVVIGNPPYIQLQRNNSELANLFENFGYETFEKTGDIYSIFYEKGIQLLKENGLQAFITSSQWLKASYGKSLKDYLAQQNPLLLVLLGPSVFEKATVDTNILISQKCNNASKLEGIIIDDTMELNTISKNLFIPMPNTHLGNWSILSPLQERINEKIRQKAKPLSEWNIKIYFGIKTGYNDAFLLTQEEAKHLISLKAKNKEIVRPVLRGRNVESYFTKWENGYVISTFPSKKVNIEKYPDIKLYLENYLPNILQTGEQVVDKLGKLIKTRKKTTHQWFETQDPIAFFEEFSKEKVIWKRIGSQLRFSYSDEEMYCLDSTCIATGEKIKYLTALLNSKVCKYQLFQNAPRTGMGDLIISVQALEPLLVHYPNTKEQTKIEKLVDKIVALKKKNPNTDTSSLESEIDTMVYELYELNDEEIKLVEGK